MTKSTKTATLFCLLAGVALLGACTAPSTRSRPTPPSRIPALRLHPEYRDAMMAAPDFTTAAMKALADAEAGEARP
jgi:uncharacterized lipoprotein YajG